MWYKFASKKVEPGFKNNETWFEIVPENIWLLRNSEVKIIKSIEIKNNLPSSIFKVTKGSKDLKNFNKLNLAKDFAEETYAEKLSKKGSKN